MKVFSELEPRAVFNHFEALTKIPRESGNEKQVSDYLVQFARDNGLEVIQEDCLNVIINKPGTPGHENAPRVILQGHMDMVCVKEDALNFDFSSDPIPVVVDGDIIKTKGTTLGADNGIAVAMAMALLESKDIPHPPLTALITVAEETGMDGVLNLNPQHISGDILINLDAEEEGVFLASCAGGVKAEVRLPGQWTESSLAAPYTISIQGLRGGHSGLEINKHRANSIRLLGRALQNLDQELSMELAHVAGGEKMNAIPKTAFADILIDEKDVDKLEAIVRDCQETFKAEHSISDPGITITHGKTEASDTVMTEQTKRNLINLLLVLPTGVQTMSANIEGLVESSNNVGVLEIKNRDIVITNAVRSSVKSLKYEICGRMKALCDLAGAEIKLSSDYPEWEYKPDSPIRDLMVEVYREMFGKEAKIEAVHAGLECGFLKEKVGDIDMISLGPNLFDVHTPNERLSISSTARLFNFLCQVLKRIK